MEYIANSDHQWTFEQSQSAVAPLRDGGFMIVWTDKVEGAGYGDIKARRFDASGHTVGSEALINASSPVPTLQHDPDVASLLLPADPRLPSLKLSRTVPMLWDNDRVAITWVDETNPQSERDIRAAIWAPLDRYAQLTPGRPIILEQVGLEARVPDFLVSKNNLGRQDYPVVVSASYGNFLLAWEDWYEVRRASTSGHEEIGVFARMCDALGNMSNEFLVNNELTNKQGNPSMASNSQGVLFTFTNSGSFRPAPGARNSGEDIVGSIVNWPTTPAPQPIDAPDFLVNPLGQNHSENGPSAQEYSATAALDSGFVVVFETDHSIPGEAPTSLSTDNPDIHGVIVSQQGAISAEFKINPAMVGDQTNPSVATLRNAKGAYGFVVVWEEYLGSSSGGTGTRDIFARVFNILGQPSGGVIPINEITIGDQMEPDVAGLPDGRFVVTWTDRSSHSGDIKFKILQP